MNLKQRSVRTPVTPFFQLPVGLALINFITCIHYMHYLAYAVYAINTILCYDTVYFILFVETLLMYNTSV